MSDTNDIKSMRRMVENLDSQAKALKEQRDSLNSEAKKWIERRDILNTNNSDGWNAIKANKEKRDEINEIVKKLKDHRLEIVAQSKKKREEYLALREKVNKLLGRTSQSANAVKHQIDKLDWEIQTNPLSPAEENELIEQVRLLERQLLIHKEAKGLKDKLIELRAELGVLRIQINEIHSQMADFTERGQEYHKKMLDELNKIKPSRDEADKAHEQYLGCRKVANEAHGKYLETVEQIRTLNSRIKEIEETEYNMRLNRQAETVAEIAYEKLKNKKKLTLEEFKLLKEKGLV